MIDEGTIEETAMDLDSTEAPVFFTFKIISNLFKHKFKKNK